MILICKQCGKEFEAKRKDAQYCSGACSKKASRERASKGINNKEKVCPKCGNTFVIKGSAFSRRYCYNCIPEIGNTGAANRKIIKKWAVEYKGGKCCKCGYDKCLDALDLHHLNPAEKDFNLSDRNLSLDWVEITPELDKCILVCANCHREIHSEEVAYEE